MSTANKRRVLVIAILVVILVIGATFPFDQRIATPCVIEPAAVWQLRLEGSGQVFAGMEHNLTGLPSKRQLYQLERPDVFDVDLSPGLHDGSTVSTGDTLAILHSREGVIRAHDTMDQLTRERKRKALLEAGARPQDIDVAKRRLERARVRLEAFRSEMDRVQALKDSNLVSEARYDETLARFQTLEAEEQLAEAQLKALRAGAHPAELDVNEAEIDRLARLAEGTSRILGNEEAIIAPFNGVFRDGNDVDGSLFSIERTDSLSLRVMVPEAFAATMHAREVLPFVLTALRGREFKAPVTSVRFCEGDTAAAYAYALIPNRENLLRTGMTGMAFIPLGERTFWQRIRGQLGTGPR